MRVTVTAGPLGLGLSLAEEGSRCVVKGFRPMPDGQPNPGQVSVAAAKRGRLLQWWFGLPQGVGGSETCGAEEVVYSWRVEGYSCLVLGHAARGSLLSVFLGCHCPLSPVGVQVGVDLYRGGTVRKVCVVPVVGVWMRSRYDSRDVMEDE